MKKFVRIAFAAILAITVSACSIVEEGNIGLRKNFDKTYDKTELIAGSFNQTVVGSVLQFPIREVGAVVNDMTPVTADNATLADVDATAIYNIQPTCVSDLFVNKSQSFHAKDDDGDTLLMYSYMTRLIRNAVYKEARKYDAMLINDKRSEFEAGVKTTLETMLAAEKLDGCIILSAVQARSLTPPPALRQAADALVKAKIEDERKNVEVAIAKKESERIAALNANAGARDYMNAQANMEIALAVREGKVQTIILPYDFKGIVNAGNK